MAQTTEIDNQSQIMKPFPINRTSFKVQESFTDDDEKITLISEYRRLDSTNFRILLNKESETKRTTETLTKNRTRPRLEVDEAHDHFFDALVLRGWLKAGDDSEQELSYKEVCELNIEQKIALNVRFLDCKAKIQKVTGAGKYDFLFRKDGNVIVEFLIGDPDSPTWSLLLKMKRPPQGRRSKFKQSFAYEVTNRAGDLPISQTVVDLSGGVRFFDEYFDTVIKDPNYSEVHFLKEGQDELDHAYVEGNDDDRKAFIQAFNPHFKVEIAGAIIAKFSKSGQES